MTDETRPLFQRFPRLAEQLAAGPRLARLPTPVQRLDLDGRALWVKRDDLTGADYGGNKTRKLDLILPLARARGARRIVTFGGLGTNHGLASAIHCAHLGLDCEILLFDQPVTAHVRDNLRLMAYFGARLRYAGGMGRALAAYYLHPRRLDPRTRFLFAGASTPLGATAYVDAALELDAQIAAGDMPEPAAVYCAAGSTGTLAGLTLGFALCERAVPVFGVRVIDSHVGPFAACTPATVTKLMRATLTHLRARDPAVPAIDPPEPQLLEGYFGGGYGVPTEAGRRALARAADAGLRLEPTYTAKTFAAALDADAGPVLYWHTLSSADQSATLAEAGDDALPAAVRRRIESGERGMQRVLDTARRRCGDAARRPYGRRFRAMWAR